jgi:hypothetical protein
MKRLITKEEIIKHLKSVDRRATNFTDEEIDTIIVDSFAEFSTVSKTISNRYIVDLSSYYSSGETKITVQIPEDVIYIYDLYLARNVENCIVSNHDELHIRNDHLIWRDTQKSDTFHINLNDFVYGDIYSLAYAEYYYIPTSADFNEIYLGNDSYIAFKDAISAVVFDYLHDTESATLKRNNMKVKASTIANIYPEDYEEPKKESIFPWGV